MDRQTPTREDKFKLVVDVLQTIYRGIYGIDVSDVEELHQEIRKRSLK